MSDISEYEQRITSALERIAKGIDQLGAQDAGAQGSGDEDSLREDLEAERAANAQLQERVRAIRVKKDAVIAALGQQVEKLQQDTDGRAADVQRLENINSQLRENNHALREANLGGIGDPLLVNKAMKTELESLRISRDGDRAELDAILSELKPLVEGRADA
jgi:cell division protein FtsB